MAFKIRFLDSGGSIGIGVQNPAIDNEPTIYVGVTAVLEFTLTNTTGAAIGMKESEDANLEIVFPTYFTNTEVQGMNITALSQSGWHAAYETATAWQLTWKGADGTWANNEVLTFTVNAVLCKGAPALDSIAVNFNNLDGANIPGTIYQPLSLNNAAPTATTDLLSVLQRSLDSQGTVFISVLQDPLANTLYLNLKNTGTNPLYNDKKMWTVKPQINVTFVYGNTAGALAPGDKQKHSNTGSAWNIVGGQGINNDWNCRNPEVTDKGDTPHWELTPGETNKDLLGIDENANVTFPLGNVISLLASGHTQLYLQFINFYVNSTTPYKPALAVVDIVKLAQPPIRGIINFFASSGPIVSLSSPKEHVTITLQAKLYYVDNVMLSCNVANVPIQKYDYSVHGVPPALKDVTYTLDMDLEDSVDTTIFITLQSFGQNGAYLNAMQFTVFVQGAFVKDPDGNIYSTVFLNNQTWLAENYMYPGDQVPGIQAYGGNTDPAFIKKYGLLYTLEAAQTLAVQLTSKEYPKGWRVPSQDDWQGLIDSFGSPENAYNALMGAGADKVQFNAIAGGFIDDTNTSSNIGDNGYYLSTTPNTGQNGYNYVGAFNTNPGTVTSNNSYPTAKFYFSLRYVKNE